MAGNINTTCIDCGARYGGNAGHCTACHRTFTSDSAFDKHFKSLVTAGCQDPAHVLTKDGRPRFRWVETRQMWSLAYYGKPRQEWSKAPSTTPTPQPVDNPVDNPEGGPHGLAH